MNQDYSIPFRLSYLLGAKENKIKSVYPNEYGESQSLKLFENYNDAKKLRIFCMLRNSIICDYSRYNKRLYKTLEGFQNITNKETSYLHNNNIKINKLFYDLDFVDYFNMLSELINALAYKVLLDMDMPYIEEISEYFYFPILTKNEIDNYVASALSVENPLHIYIYGCEKIKTTFKYSFNSNKNCIMSAFSIQGKSFISINDVSVFEFRTSLGVDLDETVLNKLQEIVEYYQGAKERRENLVKLEKERIEKEKEEARLLEEKRIAEEQAKVNSENSEVINDIIENDKLENVEISKTSNSQNEELKVSNVIQDTETLIVDCTNMDFFTFVCFIHKTEKFSKIILINNFEYNCMWNLLSDVLPKNVSVEKISIKKQDNFRFNVNTFLTHSICKNIYKSGNKLINIVSNTTDYFDLFEMIDGIKFNIYTTNIDELPLNYLQERLVSVTDISTTVDKFTTEWILKDIINYAVFYYILNRPLYDYNEKEMLYYISEKLSPAVSFNDIKPIFNNIKNSIKISILENGVKIYNEKYCVKVDN